MLMTAFMSMLQDGHLVIHARHHILETGYSSRIIRGNVFAIQDRGTERKLIGVFLWLIVRDAEDLGVQVWLLFLDNLLGVLERSIGIQDIYSDATIATPE